MDDSQYLTTRDGLQRRATQKWLDDQARVKRDIVRLLDKLTKPAPVIAPERGFFQFNGFWVLTTTSFTKHIDDAILEGAVFANEVGATVYVAWGSDRWLSIPSVGADVSLWDAWSEMTSTSTDPDTRGRGYRDIHYTKPEDLPFNERDARYAGASPEIREAMDRDKARES